MPMLNQYKAQLGDLLRKGHGKFGRVAPSKPYKDDDEGGAGTAGLTVETHPLLADLPEGAASDLTFIASDNSNITDEALERVDELTPQLQNQPSLQAELTYSHRATPRPTPYK